MLLTRRPCSFSSAHRSRLLTSEVFDHQTFVAIRFHLLPSAGLFSLLPNPHPFPARLPLSLPFPIQGMISCLGEPICVSMSDTHAASLPPECCLLMLSELESSITLSARRPRVLPSHSERSASDQNLFHVHCHASLCFLQNKSQGIREWAVRDKGEVRRSKKRGTHMRTVNAPLKS